MSSPSRRAPPPRPTRRKRSEGCSRTKPRRCANGRCYYLRAAHGEEGPSVASEDGPVSIKVIPVYARCGSEIKDDGTGAILGGLRQHRRPASTGWSPDLLSRIADRWGLVSGAEGAWVWFELDLPRGA